MTTITLKKNAWHGDEEYDIIFPQQWDVKVVENLPKPLTSKEITAMIKKPIAGKPLRELAKGKKRVVIITDDLTRATPASKILPAVLSELLAAKIAKEKITIIIGGGTHEQATKAQAAQKVGLDVMRKYRVVVHDSKKNLDYLGKTENGTSIYANKEVVAADIKIGIGSIVPHSIAGYSGGEKIIMPGICGLETITYAHRNLLGAGKRAGNHHNEFREEMSIAAEKVGLNYLVNVTLTEGRAIGKVFSGNPKKVFEKGVKYVKKNYECTIPKADIIITDTYPYDGTLFKAKDRGLWPLFTNKKKTIKIALADCAEGIGTHELFSPKDDLSQATIKKASRLRPRDIRLIPRKIRKIIRRTRQKNTKIVFISKNLKEEQVKSIFPKATIKKNWEEAKKTLPAKKQRVALIKNAPLQHQKP